MKRLTFWLTAALIAGTWSLIALVLFSLGVSPTPALRAQPLGMWLIVLVFLGHMLMGIYALNAMADKHRRIMDAHTLMYIGGTRTIA